MKKQTYNAALLATDKLTDLYTFNNSLHFDIFHCVKEDNKCAYKILYILSDEEIKEGDYYISCLSNRILQRTIKMDIVEPQDQKIIASTNKSLNLPWIDLSKSQWILDYYNEKKALPEIEIELENIYNNTWGKNIDSIGTKLKLTLDESVNIIEPVKADTIPKFDSPKNWTEDYKLENGNYICHCNRCGNNFFGYKRRIICKECYTNLSVPYPEKSDEELKESIPSNEYIKLMAEEYKKTVSTFQYSVKEKAYIQGLMDMRKFYQNIKRQ